MYKKPIIFILLFLSMFIIFLFPGCQPTISDLSGSTLSGQAALPGSLLKDITGYTPIPGATVTANR